MVVLTGPVRVQATLAAAALASLPWLGGHQGGAGRPSRAEAGAAQPGPGQGAGAQVRAAEQAQLKAIDAPACLAAEPGPRGDRRRP